MSKDRLPILPDDFGADNIELSILDHKGVPATELIVQHLIQEKQVSFPDPIPLDYAVYQRRRALLEFALNESSLSSSILSQLVGTASGLLIGREIDTYYETLRAYGNPNREQIEACVKQTFELLQQRENRTTHITLFEDIPDVLIRARKDSLRSVVVFGAFDAPHIEHSMLLDEACTLAGKHGVVTVFVASDRMVESKGENRPLYEKHARLNTIANLRRVDHVVGIPEFEGSEIDFFRGLQESIQYDFRLVGPGEPNERMRIYNSDVRASNGLLVVSNRNSRTISTSGIIERVRNTP